MECPMRSPLWSHPSMISLLQHPAFHAVDFCPCRLGGNRHFQARWVINSDVLDFLAGACPFGYTSFPFKRASGDELRDD
eukprot:5112717-Amphidinium_carterae.1